MRHLRLPARICLPPHPGRISFSYQAPQHKTGNNTTTPPVTAPPGRLSSNRLQAVRRTFEHMRQLGIIRPFSSNHSSSLHMVQKTTGTIGARVMITEPSTHRTRRTSFLCHTFTNLVRGLQVQKYTGKNGVVAAYL